MGFICKIFGHKWNGCKCVKCGTTRDDGHNWLIVKGKCIEKCSICGKERSVEHKWNGCRCERCGTIRDEQHDWDLCKGKCKRCSKTQPEQHIWDGCKCSRCGKVRDEGHKYLPTKSKCIEECSICGKEIAKHTWNGCKCTLCGEVRDVNHHFLQVEGKCVEKCSVCSIERNLEHDYVMEHVKYVDKKAANSIVSGEFRLRLSSAMFVGQNKSENQWVSILL